MEADGADLIDIGGESTRPGRRAAVGGRGAAPRAAGRRGAARRRARAALDRHLQGRRRRAALDAGAAIVNDVSGLQYDPALARSSPRARRGARADAHARAPDDMYARGALRRRGRRSRRGTAATRGARRPRPACPTSGLSSTPASGLPNVPAHSYGVLARLAEIAAALDRPLLVGPSRKSFMREALGDRPPAGPRLGDGRRGDRRGARRRAHRPRARVWPRWCRWCGWPKRCAGGDGGSMAIGRE